MSRRQSEKGCDDDDAEINVITVDGPWPEKNEGIFLDLMISEDAKGNRPTTTFTKGSWDYIKEQLHARTGLIYNHSQLKNKYNSLRQSYRKLRKLLNYTNGAGWDPVSGTITLQNNVWDALIKADKSVKRFKKKGCPHYEKLKRLYGDAVTTADHASPLAMLPSFWKDDNDQESNTKLSNDDPDDDKDESQSHSSSSRKTPKKRKSDSISSLIVNGTNGKEKNKILRQKVIGSASASSNGKDGAQTIDEDLMRCFEILNSMHDIDGVTYSNALKLMRADATWRKLFLLMPTNRKKDFICNL